MVLPDLCQLGCVESTRLLTISILVDRVEVVGVGLLEGPGAGGSSKTQRIVIELHLVLGLAVSCLAH